MIGVPPSFFQKHFKRARRLLIIIDIEGNERDLGDPRYMTKLCRADLLNVRHDRGNDKILQELKNRLTTSPPNSCLPRPG